ncbi:MAG: chitinase [Verrucomicrobiales bacterium]|jgi:chitinase
MAFHRLLLTTLGILAFAPICNSAERPAFEVIGYLPAYRIGTVTQAQASCLGQLIYFGIKPPADGALPEEIVPATTIARLKALKQKSKCTLSICVGGWGRSEGFAPMAKSPEARKRFITGMLEFCKEHGVTGIDYDWEHPRDAAELGDYSKLLIESASAFHEVGLQVTVAQAGWQDLGAEAYKAIDRVHLMAYDHDFPQATLDKSSADVKRLVDWGCPPAKIALGLPFYGRNQARQSRTYDELVQGKAVDAKLDLIDGYAFNGRGTLVEKLVYTKKQELAGVMIWEIGQDSSDPDHSLMKVISDFKEITAPEPLPSVEKVR